MLFQGTVRMSGRCVCVACLQVFQVWLDRGVLARKVLEPHLEQLKSHPVVVPPADEPDILMETAKLDDFGCALLPIDCRGGPLCTLWRSLFFPTQRLAR